MARKNTAGLVRGLVGLGLLTTLFNLFFPNAPSDVSVLPHDAGQSRLGVMLSKLPLYFIENRGQVDERVAYYVQGRDTTLAFTAEGVTFVFTQPTPPLPRGENELFRPAAVPPEPPPSDDPHRWVLKLDFVGANPHVMPHGQDQTPAVISYFKGPQEQWQTGLSTYKSIVYPNLWPGIDLMYSGTSGQLKYTFLVQPGADPNQIKFSYRGATGVSLTDKGQLQVTTPLGGFTDDTPYAYQEEKGQRVEVAAAYALETATVTDTHVYGFRVGSYDASKELILDPAVLVYAGYIGGLGGDFGRAIAVDSDGNAYVTGLTDAIGPAFTPASFPVTVGPDLTHNGYIDAFVAQVKANGRRLIYAGYIGGDGGDESNAIAADEDGNIYVTGLTVSTEASFPLVTGPALTLVGDGAAFVAKIGQTGTPAPPVIPSPLEVVLSPTSRAVQVGTMATTCTARNTGTEPATDVGITLPSASEAGSAGLFAFLYQTISEAGVLTGTPNTPVTIAPGGTQNFVLGVIPVTIFPPFPLIFTFAGTNTLPAPAIRGVNTLFLAVTDSQPPDPLAAIVTCASDDGLEGVLNLPGANGANAFAMAVLNIGATGQITIRPTDAGLGVQLFICQTDPQTGQCLLTPGKSVTLQMGGGTTATFAVFAQGTFEMGSDPVQRIFVQFHDVMNQTLGEVSVPVRTHSPACAP